MDREVAAVREALSSVTDAGGLQSEVNNTLSKEEGKNQVEPCET